MKTNPVLATRKLAKNREIRSSHAFHMDDCYFPQVIGTTLLLHPTLPEYISGVCRVHLGSRTSGRGVCVTIPSNLVDALGWTPGKDYITLRRGRESIILLDKATSDEIVKYASPTPKKPETGTNVRRMRYLYLTKEQRQFLQIPVNTEKKNIFLKATVNLVGKAIYKIEPIGPKDKSLPTMEELLRIVGGKEEFYKKPRTFKFHYQYCVILPAEVARQFNLEWPKDTLSYTIDGKGLVFYKNSDTCDITGKQINTLHEIPRQVPVCSDCEETVPAVRRNITKNNGSINLALAAAKNELQDAMALLNTLLGEET